MSILANVVLPLPLPPTMKTSSPGRTSRSMGPTRNVCPPWSPNEYVTLGETHLVALGGRGLELRKLGASSASASVSETSSCESFSSAIPTWAQRPTFSISPRNGPHMYISDIT